MIFRIFNSEKFEKQVLENMKNKHKKLSILNYIND